MITRIYTTDWSRGEAPLRALRRRVFIEEQQVPEELEWEEEDHTALHFLTFSGATPIATARLLPSGQIGRMAVIPEYRGKGVGRALLLAVLASSKALSHPTPFLHAQTHALDFYSASGFTAEGPEFMDAGIPHRNMRLDQWPALPEPPAAWPVLGEDSGYHFIQAEPLAYQLHAWLLASQSRRQLRLYSPNLDHTIFNHPALQDAFSALARAGRQSRIRIILRDPRPAIARSHRLVELARRLSSTIEIRRAPPREEDGPDNSYLLADDRGLLWLPEKTEQRGYAHYNYPARVRELGNAYEQLWEQSESEPELRILGI